MNIIDRFALNGRWIFRLYRNKRLIWEEDVANLIVNEGRNYILNAGLSGGTQLTQWFLAPFSTNYTPVLTETAATVAASAGEQTNYSEPTRVLWVDAGASGQIINNTASPAEFTFAGLGGPTLVYGLFLASASGKGATTGTLWAAARFSTARTVENGDVGRGTYSVNAN